MSAQHARLDGLPDVTFANEIKASENAQLAGKLLMDKELGRTLNQRDDSPA